MTLKYSLEIAKVAKVLIEEMFQVQAGETVAITADSGTNTTVTDALANAAYAAGGIPLILTTPRGTNCRLMRSRCLDRTQCTYSLIFGYLGNSNGEKQEITLCYFRRFEY